jgi:hypothetical protein
MSLVVTLLRSSWSTALNPGLGDLFAGLDNEVLRN